MERKVNLVKIGEVSAPTVPLRLREDFDEDALKFLRTCTIEVIYGDSPSQKKQGDFAYFKSCMRKYKRSVSYELKDNVAPYGRLYSNGLQTAPRVARALLCGGVYVELDFENCQARILLRVAEEKGWKCEALRKFVKERNEILQQLMTTSGKTRDEAKEAVTAAMFGAAEETLREKGVPEGSFILTQLLPEVRALHITVAKDTEYATLRSMMPAHMASKNKPPFKLPSSMTAFVLQTYERLALEAVVKELKDHGREVMAYLHDGVLVRGADEPLPDDILRACEGRVYADTGIPLKLASKRVEAPPALKAAFEASRGPARKRARKASNNDSGSGGDSGSDSDSDSGAHQSLKQAARVFYTRLDKDASDGHKLRFQWAQEGEAGLGKLASHSLKGHVKLDSAAATPTYYYWDSSKRLWEARTSSKMIVIINEAVIASLAPLRNYLVGVLANVRAWLDEVKEAGVDEDAIATAAVEVERAEKRCDIVDRAFTAISSTTTMRNVESYLRAAKDLVADVSKLDGAMDQLPTLGGMVVDLRTGAVRERTQEDLWTRELQVAHNVDCDIMPMMEFVGNMFPDASIANFVRCAMGYCVTGETNLRTYFLLYGETRNGKSALATLMHAVLGNYYQTINRADLTVSKFKTGTVNESIAKAAINRARVAVLLETDNEQAAASAPLDWQLIKNISGEDRVSSSMKHKSAVETRLECKILIGTNNLPSIPGAAEADRTTYIPCMTFFCNEANVDMTRLEQRRAVLEGRRRDEDRAAFEFLQSPAGRPAVLAWLVQGTVDYYTAGRALPPCPALVESKKAFLLRANPVHQWLTRRYEVTGNANDRVSSEEVSRELKEGVKEADERAATWNGIVDYLKARGCDKTKKRVAGFPNPVSVFMGLKTKVPELEAGDEGAAVEPNF